MSLRAVRTLAGVFFVSYTIVLTYPGLLPFNRIHPLILGLPFYMGWIALWILLGIAVFYLAYRAEEREEDE